MKQRVRDGVAGSGLHELLILQAQARMMAGGDSEHTYPDLWGHPGSYRADGQPLMDDAGRGGLFSRLAGTTTIDGNVITATLLAPLYAIYHQHGFTTKGPNFIPLTLRAKRDHMPGANPANEGLEPWNPKTGEGDYVMAWRGVTVPQRKIFNLPQEDRADILTTIRLGIKQTMSAA